MHLPMCGTNFSKRSFLLIKEVDIILGQFKMGVRFVSYH